MPDGIKTFCTNFENVYNREHTQWLFDENVSYFFSNLFISLKISLKI